MTLEREAAILIEQNAKLRAEVRRLGSSRSPAYANTSTRTGPQPKPRPGGSAPGPGATTSTPSGSTPTSAPTAGSGTSEHDPPDRTTMTEVQIRLPLPLDIAGNLMWAIGQMWPDTKILSTNTGVLRFEIPDDAPRAELDPEDAPNARLHTDDAGKLWVLDPEGTLIEPAEVISQWAAALARASLRNVPEAENYLELQLGDREGTIRVGVIILNPDGGKTPNELRQEAVAEVEKLKLRVAELEAALWAAKGDAAILKDL